MANAFDDLEGQPAAVSTGFKAAPVGSKPAPAQITVRGGAPEKPVPAPITAPARTGQSENAFSDLPPKGTPPQTGPKDKKLSLPEAVTYGGQMVAQGAAKGLVNSIIEAPDVLLPTDLGVGDDPSQQVQVDTERAFTKFLADNYPTVNIADPSTWKEQRQWNWGPISIPYEADLRHEAWQKFVAAGGASYLQDAGKKSNPLTSDAIKSGLSGAGLNINDYFKTPDDEYGQMMEMGGSFIPGILAPARALPFIGKAQKLLNAESKIGKAAQLAGLSATGVGLGATTYQATKNAPDELKPIVGLGTTLLGAGAAIPLHMAVGRLRKSLGNAAEYLAPAMPGYNKERAAGARLAASLDKNADLDEVQFELRRGANELVPGSKPTAAKASARTDINALERARAINDQDFRGMLNERVEQNAAKRVEFGEDLKGNSAPVAVADYFNARMRDLEDRAEALQNQRQQAADAARADIGEGAPAAEVGARARAAIDENFKALNAEASKVWQSLPDDMVVDTGPLFDRVEQIYGDITPEKGMGITEAEAKLLGLMEDYGTTLSFKRFRDLRSALFRIKVEAGRAGNNEAAGRLSQLMKGMEDAVGESIQTRVAQEEAAVAAGQLNPENTLANRFLADADSLEGQPGNMARPATGNGEAEAAQQAAVSGAGRAAGEAGAQPSNAEGVQGLPPRAGNGSDAGVKSELSGTDGNTSYTIRTIKRSDGTFAIERDITEGGRTVTEHLREDGWERGRAATTVVSGDAISLNDLLSFRNKDDALKFGREMSGENIVWNDSSAQTKGEPYGQGSANAAEQRPPVYAAEPRPGSDTGRPGGAGVPEETLPAAEQYRRKGPQRSGNGDLKGLPTEGGKYHNWPEARSVAEAYMAKAGLPYNPPNTFAKVNPERAKRIADAFEQMKHDPQNPEVKAAYDAMAKETLAQYQAILDSGVTFEFIPKGADDPYKGNPRNMTEDVRINKHMWVFPTDQGFGSGKLDVSDNPLLADSGFKFGDKPATINDIFRAVHDYFGHVKEGVGFRANGEENAWRAHSAMYSPLARKAMTTETRGQNSWVNFGPHGETNKTAKSEDTVYAEQKIGLLPDWVIHEGAGDGTVFDNMSETFQAAGVPKEQAEAAAAYNAATYEYIASVTGMTPEELFAKYPMKAVKGLQAGDGVFFQSAVGASPGGSDTPSPYFNLSADMNALTHGTTSSKNASDAARKLDDLVGWITNDKALNSLSSWEELPGIIDNAPHLRDRVTKFFIDNGIATEGSSPGAQFAAEISKAAKDPQGYHSGQSPLVTNADYADAYNSLLEKAKTDPAVKEYDDTFTQILAIKGLGDKEWGQLPNAINSTPEAYALAKKYLYDKGIDLSQGVGKTFVDRMLTIGGEPAAKPDPLAGLMKPQYANLTQDQMNEVYWELTDKASVNSTAKKLLDAMSKASHTTGWPKGGPDNFAHMAEIIDSNPEIKKVFTDAFPAMGTKGITVGQSVQKALASWHPDDDVGKKVENFLSTAENKTGPVSENTFGFEPDSTEAMIKLNAMPGIADKLKSDHSYGFSPHLAATLDFVKNFQTYNKLNGGGKTIKEAINTPMGAELANEMLKQGNWSSTAINQIGGKADAVLKQIEMAHESLSKTLKEKEAKASTSNKIIEGTAKKLEEAMNPPPEKAMPDADQVKGIKAAFAMDENAVFSQTAAYREWMGARDVLKEALAVIGKQPGENFNPGDLSLMIDNDFGLYTKAQNAIKAYGFSKDYIESINSPAEYLMKLVAMAGNAWAKETHFGNVAKEKLKPVEPGTDGLTFSQRVAQQGVLENDPSLYFEPEPVDHPRGMLTQEFYDRIINDPRFKANFANSKAVRDGLPVVVMHGADNHGWRHFATDRFGPAFGAADPIDPYYRNQAGVGSGYKTARHYTGGKKGMVLPMTPETALRSPEYLAKMYGPDAKVVQAGGVGKDQRYEVVWRKKFSGDTQREYYRSRDELLADIEKRITKNQLQDTQSGVGAFFYNLENPYEIDFEGSVWNDSPAGDHGAAQEPPTVTKYKITHSYFGDIEEGYDSYYDAKDAMRQCAEDYADSIADDHRSEVEKYFDVVEPDEEGGKWVLKVEDDTDLRSTVARYDGMEFDSERDARNMLNELLDEETDKVRDDAIDNYLQDANVEDYDYDDPYAQATGEGMDTDSIARWARDEGYDGVIFRNIRDDGPTADVYVAFDPSQIKSAFNPGVWGFGDDDNLFLQSARHDTPHFFDQFELSKKTIKTGEGNLDFGHGLYFWQNHKAGEYYRETVAGRDGYEYTVELPENEELLHWDLPLEQQSQYIKDALDRLPEEYQPQPGDRGKDIYWRIEGDVGGERASRVFADAGIPGHRYRDGGSRGNMPEEKRTHNIVMFDDRRIKIVDRKRVSELDQPGVGSDAPRGAIRLNPDGSAIIHMFENADASTPIHEPAHQYMRMMSDFAAQPDAPVQMSRDWHTTQNWLHSNASAVARDSGRSDVTASHVRTLIRKGTTGVRELDVAINRGMQEQFARGYERYIMEGKSPTKALEGVFARFKGWLTKIYKTADALNVNLTPEMRDIYARLLGGKTPTMPEPKRITKAQADAYKEARAKTRNIKETFDDSNTVSDIISRSKGSTMPFDLTDEGVAAKIWQPGPVGAGRIKEVLKAGNNSPEIRQAIREAAVNSINATALKGDRYDPAKLAAWRAKHVDALREFPDLDRQLQTAEGAERALVQIGAARAKATKAAQQGAIGKIMKLDNDADVVRAVGSVLQSQNSVQNMRTLVNQARRDPMAMEGLQSAVIQHMLDTMKGTTMGYRAEPFNKYFGKHANALNEVLSPDQISALQRLAADLKRENTEKRAPVRGSPTKENFADASRHGFDGNSMWDRIIQNGISAGLGSSVGAAASMVGMVPGGWLTQGVATLGGLFTNHLLQKMRANGIEKVEDLIRAALLDPELFADLLAKAPKRAGSGSHVTLGNFLTRAALAGITGPAALDQPDREEKKPAFANGGAVKGKDVYTSPPPWAAAIVKQYLGDGGHLSAGVIPH